MVWSDVQHREVSSVSCFGCAWISGTALRHAPLTSSSSRPLLVPSISHLNPLAGGTHQPPGSTWTVMLLTSTIMPNCSDGSAVTLKNFMKYFLHQSCKERQHTEKLIQVQHHRGGQIFWRLNERAESSEVSISLGGERMWVTHYFNRTNQPQTQMIPREGPPWHPLPEWAGETTKSYLH